jgi:hypothetical protein
MRSYLFGGVAGFLGLALALASSEESQAAPKPKLPDLRIMDITYSGSTVQVRVHNQGHADTTQPCRLRVWIRGGSSKLQRFPLPLQLRYAVVPALKQGHSATLTVNFGSLSLSGKTIYAYVDSSNVIAESDETNNSASKAVP